MMHGRISMYMYAFVLCSLCRRVAIVDAQPTVNASILTPPLDRRVGGRVDMRCVAMNLEPNYMVEWKIKDPNDNTNQITLRWGNATVTYRSMYEYTTVQTNEATSQYLTITDLQISHAGDYICNVNVPMQQGGSNIVASDRVTLSVLDSNFQFPNDSFPMCSPDGPVTIDTGTELNFRCLSEGMNSAIMMDVFQISPASNSFTWTPSNTADTLLMSLSLTAEVIHDGISFQCVISSVPYPELRSSCIIGPISIRGVMEPTTKSTTEATEPTTIPTEPTQPPSTSPPGSTAAIAGAAAGGIAALLLVLILIMICRRRGMICSNDSNKSHDSSIPAKDELDHRRNDSLANAEFGRTKAQHDDLYPSGIRQTSQLYAVAVSTNPVHKHNKDNVMCAKPLNKPYKPGSKSDAISREQNHNNPAFDWDEATDPPFDVSPSRPVGVATVMMANEKTPPKPRPYSSKTKTDKHVILSPPPDSEDSTQNGGLGGGTNQRHSDQVSYASYASDKTPRKPRPYSSKTKTDKHATPSPPTDSKNSTHNVGLGGETNQPHTNEVSYASISSPLQIHDGTEKQTPSTKPVVYADLDLQPESPPNDGQGASPPVYATVN